LEEATKKIEAFEDKWAISFDEFKERCGHDELPDKSDPYSWEVEEDFREWETAKTLKEHYSRILDRYTSVTSFVEAILGESEESGIITHTEVNVEGPITKIRLTKNATR